MKKVNCITINTDASYKNNVGGYAFYIVCDMFKIQKGGYFKAYVNDSNDCETMCIANALHTLLHQKELPECSALVVNTDSKISINRITNNYTQIGRKTNKILKKLKRKLKCKVSFRHVKAHVKISSSRRWVNDWCDRESKKWRVLKEKKNKL